MNKRNKYTETRRHEATKKFNLTQRTLWVLKTQRKS